MPTDNTLPNQKKILIVEDDFFIRDLYEIEAKQAGYIVTTAVDGEVAITIARAELPDLILLDLMLPKVDGITVLKTLKQDPKTNNIPIIIITNLADSSKEQEARAAGAKDYLLKIRNTPNQIIERVKEYL